MHPSPGGSQVLLHDLPGTQSSYSGLRANTGPWHSAAKATIVNGGEEFWLGGAPHQVSFADENEKCCRIPLALPEMSCWWEQGDLTLRIESKLEKEQAVSIARIVS